MTTCPQCGYEEKPTSKQAHTIMHEYITADGKKSAVMNRNEEKFDVTKGEGKDAVTITWIRKDKYTPAAPSVKTPEPPKK